MRRVGSTGIIESSFEYKNLNFALIDLAGERGERQKLRQCFEDVTAIVFCVDLCACYQVTVKKEKH